MAEVLLIQVLAEPTQCVARIRGRDASIHIPISDEELERINSVAAQIALPWAATIDNRSELNTIAILDTIVALIRNLKD